MKTIKLSRVNDNLTKLTKSINTTRVINAPIQHGSYISRHNFHNSSHNNTLFNSSLGHIKHRINKDLNPTCFQLSLTTSTHFRDENDLRIRKALQNYKLNENDHIRCTIFDEKGEMVQHSKDFKRSVFMKENNLVPRDFRKISRHHNPRVSGATNTSADIVPSIITRSNFILLNLLNVRALIKNDCVVLFESAHNATHGARLNESHSYSSFLQDMTFRLRNEDLPYEFRALEAILIYVIGNLNTEMKVHSTVLQNILHGLEHSIDRVKLRYLLIQLKKITQFHRKSLLIRDLLNDILENDDELNDLYLTDCARGIARKGANHEEIELILETYYKTVDEIVQTVENLKSQIRTTEEIINMILDSNRNELMLLGLKYLTGLLLMGATLYVAALYGMNLENFIEESDGGFELVVVVSTLLLFGCLFASVKLLRRLQKVTMTMKNR